jgi:hypothetical protein
MSRRLGAEQGKQYKNEIDHKTPLGARNNLPADVPDGGLRIQ